VEAEQEFKQIDYSTYTQFQTQSDAGTITLEHFKRFNTAEFIGALSLPDGCVYSEYFKRRLHKLCIEGIVRPDDLATELLARKLTRHPL
jgi:hypothetical protein